MTPLAADGLHVRLLLPQTNTTVQWPQLNAQGRLQWDAGQTPLPQRIYTIRQYDTRAQWVDIDIVRHDHDAPGAQWLAQAAPRRHWLARGSGARHMAGSNAKGWGARPRFSASDKSCSCGAMKLQSSSACCRVWAAPVA